MRLHRFYVTQIIGDKKEIEIHSPELIHQIKNVFRLNVRDKVIIFNGTGFDYECNIDGFGNESKISSNSVIRLTVVGSIRNNNISKREIFLCAGIVKKDNFEWIVEKATELGVTGILPISAERSEKKSLNEERLRKIAIEASEQSGRDATPMVWKIMGLGSAVSSLKKENFGIEIIAFHTEGEDYIKYKILKIKNGDEDERDGGLKADRQGGGKSLAVFIGPEGGWSPAEIEVFHKENIPVVCLGPQVLRAETAAVAALSMVVFG